jgi:hypothetical protein
VAELTAGARLTKKRERSDQLGRRKPKGKTHSRRDATDTWAVWASEGGFRPAGTARPAGPAGPKAEGAARSAGPKARKKNF